MIKQQQQQQEKPARNEFTIDKIKQLHITMICTLVSAVMSAIHHSITHI